MSLKVDFAASRPHYVAHLAPIWHALPLEARGRFLAYNETAKAVVAQGISPEAVDATESSASVIVGAAWRDIRRASNRVKTVLIEHGAGQSYGGRGYKHPAYAGGEGRERLTRHLVPRPKMVNSTRDIWIGNPRLDLIHVDLHRPKPERPVIGATWHWPCKISQESGTAFFHYVQALAEVNKHPELGGVIATAHPLFYDDAAEVYRRLGIPHTPHWDIVNQADMLIADSTSVMYEFAASARPVISCNAPQWRRVVHHGLRFWEHELGMVIDEPAELLPAVLNTWRYYDLYSIHAAVEANFIYGKIGGATERAVEAILGL